MPASSKTLRDEFHDSSSTLPSREAEARRDRGDAPVNVETSRGAAKEPPPPSSERFALLGMRVFAVVMIVLGFLPIANWIPEGHEFAFFTRVTREWFNGTLIVAGCGAVLTILSRRLPIWRPAVITRITDASSRRPRAVGLVLFVVSLASYLVVARWVLAARPLLIDEIDTIFNARIFLQGKLWLDPPRFPEFVSALHVIDFGGKYLTHFPPGGALILAPGVALGIPWVIHPLLAASTSVLFWMLARRVEPRPGVALAATILFAFSPFVVFLSGSFMNHVPVMTSLLAAMYALARQTEDDDTHPVWAAIAGFMLGLPAALRPMDAVAFAVPAGLWMLVRTVRRPARVWELVAAGVSITIPVGAVLWYNARVTGAPLTFPMEMLWGKIHGLGFHDSPWGLPHTPARGLELINLYFLRLQSTLYELPIPSLVIPIATLLLMRRLERLDRYFLVTAVVVVVLYFTYWGDGNYLGPRYFLVLVPAFALWSARLPSVLRERFPGWELLHRGVVFAAISAGVIAAFVGVPFRALEYQTAFRPMRVDYDSLARAQGVRGAVVLVREAWGSQLIARMWALGIPRTDTESLYRAVDGCVLDRAVEQLERTGARNESALRQLQPLVRDSARLEKGVLTPDRTLRSLRGSIYDGTCATRVLEDRAGFTLATSTLANAPTSNLFVRDLHARDTVLVKEYHERPFYLLRPISAENDAPLILEPLKRDSVAAEWKSALPLTLPQAEPLSPN